MRIVITGATGNVGTAVLRRLAADGGHDLVGVARRVPDGPTVAGGREVTWHAVDLSEETARLDDVVAGADAVVHLAWGFQPTHDVAYLERLGVGGTGRVLDAVLDADVPHLVHLSSLGAYSPRSDDTPVDESWPTGGVRTSPYSRHKVAAERLLDAAEGSGTTITRLRPGIVGQRAAGSALLRYGVPGPVPARVLGLLPILPLDRRLRTSMVHADDVADAVARTLDRRPTGAFNLAAPEPLTAQDMADAFGARLVHVPSAALRPLVSASWHAHLQQVDAGWLDMAFALPHLDSTRARTELGWTTTRTAAEVFAEVVDGMRTGATGPTPVLRPRTLAQTLTDAVRRGPVAKRRVP